MVMMAMTMNSMMTKLMMKEAMELVEMVDLYDVDMVMYNDGMNGRNWFYCYCRNRLFSVRFYLFEIVSDQLILIQPILV